ncbi:MAG: type II toxin-antitoxin system PemK/MazF family toxin [Planctomycetales bacterium]|nr:type II toxin-antitoxin system PemK/MazF family toxin [Planctomycetales bacterium]
MATSDPLRGDVWDVNLDPTQGREQKGRRPALVVSADAFNRGAADLVIVVPITSQAKQIPIHVKIDAPEGGLKTTSFAKPEDMRSVSKTRLGKRWGSVSTGTMAQVEDMLRVLMAL